ncbi:MAG: hypothetical protein ACU841_09395 [Gammaproteobacteria bacterium]
MTVRTCMASLNERSATVFLLLLVGADFAFMVLHVVNHAMPEPHRNPLLRLDKDGAYPELYQYVKYFWIIALLVHRSIDKRSVHYMAWVLIFIYLLSDDSLRIHEQFGRSLSKTFEFTPPFGLKPNDVGELVVSGAMALILFPSLVWAYWSGSGNFRETSRDILLLLAVLVFFGVVVDTAHMVIKLGWAVGFILGIVEDGGEMVTVSLILWYLFLLVLRGENTGCHLYELVRSAMAPMKRG